MRSTARAAPVRPGPRYLTQAPLLLGIAALVACGLFVLPLAAVLRLALLGDEGGFGAVGEALASGPVQRALWRSVESAGLAAIGATVAGGALGLLLGLTDVRGRHLLSILVLMLTLIPAHVVAIAWIGLLGPSSALLGAFGVAPPPGSTNPLYSRGGVILLLSLQQVPLVFLCVRAGLRALPRDLAEAARVSGAGPWRLLTRVILPLMRPALVAGLALAFVAAIGNFAVPALLGIPARYVTLPVLIWQRLASSGPSVLTDVAILALVIGVVAALAAAVQMRLVARLSVSLIGPPQAPLRLPLGRARAAVEAGLWVLLLVVVVLPLLSMVATALLPTLGVPLSWETASARHFGEVLLRQDVTLRALANSAGLAVAAAAGVTVLAIGLGALMREGGAAGRGARSIALMAETAYALPGLVISVAFIIVFLRPLPILGLSIYGTHAIILGAYLAAFLALGLKPVVVAFAALDPALDDAARVAGAGFWRRLLRIDAPLVLPAGMSGAVLVALIAFSEVTLSSILWTRGTETLGTVIFNYEDGGYAGLAAAMSVVAVLATLSLMAVLDRLGRRLPPGIVPWRD